MIKNFLFNREIRFNYIAKLSGYYPKMSDECYLKKCWKAKFGTELNLENPQSFNEKLQWLKINNRNPEYTRMVDKYEAKKYVSDRIGDDYIIPTFGVWENFDDIDFNELPNQLVLKCTHDSGGLVIVRDKSNFDVQAAKKKINKYLKRKYFYEWREWPYKNVKPRIIAEKYISDESSEKELTDYKFMCFNGKNECVFVCTERMSESGLKINIYDKDWNPLPFKRHYPKSDKEIDKPKSYKKMVSIAEKLAEKIPFLRVDFYEIDGQIYFGELTFYPSAGFGEFNPESWDKTLGDWLKLPDVYGGGVHMYRHFCRVVVASALWAAKAA